jgi:hypothetical protein
MIGGAVMTSLMLRWINLRQLQGANRDLPSNRFLGRHSQMAIPDYRACMLPLLKLAEDRNDHALKDAIPALAKQFQLTDAPSCRRADNSLFFTIE